MARSSRRSKPTTQNPRGRPRLPPQGAVAPSSGQRRQGQPVPEAVRRHALGMVASGIRPRLVARQIGVTSEALRLWRRKAEAEGTMPTAASEPPADAQAPPTVPVTNPVHADTAPHDPGQGLSTAEVEAILDLKKRHPSMGPAQIRAQLKRFKGWRVSGRAIAGVLKRAGYELVHVAARPQGQEHPQRWEAPYRNALWQLDFAELRVGPERVSLLVIEDDFSRFVVGHALFTEPTSEALVEVFRETIRRHGKPEAVYTDRGGAFLAWRNPSDFQRFLDDQLIDHHVSPAYRPQGRGKIEALIKTVQRELWEIEHLESIDHARAALARFVHRYNHARAHLSLDGLTPADRFFGRAPEVLARVEAHSRKRQAAHLAAHGPDPFLSEEEALGDGPLEVLRLVVQNGTMEIRLLGHRVRLGRLEP